MFVHFAVFYTFIHWCFILHKLVRTYHNEVCLKKRFLFPVAKIYMARRPGNFCRVKVVTLRATQVFFKRILANEHFFSGNGSNYVKKIFCSWPMDPNNVHKCWKAHFTNLKNSSENANISPPEPVWEPLESNLKQVWSQTIHGLSQRGVADNIEFQRLIPEYRSRAHAIANLDPSGINSADLDSIIPVTFEWKYYNFNDPKVCVKVTPNTFFLGTGDIIRWNYLWNAWKNLHSINRAMRYHQVSSSVPQESTHSHHKERLIFDKN